MDLRFASGLLAGLVCACTTPAAIGESATHRQAGPQCNLLPSEVWSSTAYAGWSQSQLCGAGQGPLWHGTPEGIARITRFTFTHGHSVFFRYAVISERDDGRAWIEFGGGDRLESGWEERETRRRDLSAADLAQLNALAEESGTFDHSVGTWDGGELYMHCQLLEMERAEGDDYSFSSVNIGCNQPERLLPLVRHVMDLAWLEFVEGGRVIR